MDQHNKTIAATDEVAWRAICREIAAAGFRTVEVWEAHAAPEALDEAKARLWKRILDDHGLWEDEPEDRNPMDSAARNREWIEKRLAG